MTTKKPSKTAKSTGKPGKKAAKAPTRRGIPSPHKSTTAGTPTRQRAAVHGSDAVIDQEPAHGRVDDPSDLARDQRLRKEMEEDSARSPSDRHRERLTAVEAEEDGVRDDDDEGDNAADQREEAISEQDNDEDRS